MEIFLLLCAYVLLLGISAFLIILLCNSIKSVRLNKLKIDVIEKNLYTQLRELQFKARNISKLAKKLLKQKNSFMAEITSNVIIALMPFKKLRTILLVRKLMKNLQE
ncbi:MAG: hypothetical protein MJ180_05095 [Candidatus Gastranaerophilales bacterium]|nr:hypothetical protein [Candidatus Gastranaerophilales bacterium]